MRSSLLLGALFIAMTLVGEGFVAGTFVCTPNGRVAIEELSIGDRVVTCDFDKGYSVESIVSITSHEATDFIRLKISDVTIDVESDHKFFLPFEQEWIQASDLIEGMCVLGAPLHAEYVETVEKIDQIVKVYNFSLAKYHNYLVSERSVMVHNFAQFACAAVGVAKGATVINAFLLANPLTAPVAIGVGGAALISYVAWTFWSAFKESRNVDRIDKSKSDSGRESSAQKRKASGSNQPPGKRPNNKNDNDAASPGAAAIALLKAIDESKEKAAEVFQKTCEWITTTRNGLQAIMHAFRPNCEHNFGSMLTRMGVNIADGSPEGEKRVIEAGTQIVIDITKKLVDMGAKLKVNSEGIFRDIVIEYRGELITVRGRIHEGIIKVSTMFIQPQHVRYKV
jgi:hypothetical protein